MYRGFHVIPEPDGITALKILFCRLVSDREDRNRRNPSRPSLDRILSRDTIKFPRRSGFSVKSAELQNAYPGTRGNRPIPRDALCPADGTDERLHDLCRIVPCCKSERDDTFTALRERDTAGSDRRGGIPAPVTACSRRGGIGLRFDRCYEAFPVHVAEVVRRRQFFKDLGTLPRCRSAERSQRQRVWLR